MYTFIQQGCANYCLRGVLLINFEKGQGLEHPKQPKPKLYINCKTIHQIWFVDDNVVPGSTRILGEITLQSQSTVSPDSSISLTIKPCVGLISVYISPGLLLSVFHWFVRVCNGVARSTATVLKKTLQSVQQKRATNGCTNRGIDFSDPLVTGLCPLNRTTVQTTRNVILKNSHS